MELFLDNLLEVVVAVNGFLWNFLLLFILCGVGIYYTFKLKFIQVRKFGEGFRLVFGNLKLNGEKKEHGEMTPFQSLATAIAAQVGTGNLTGAATALLSGGPGAIFWMWLSAFFGMATIYSEATLAQKYKTVVDGEVTGGPVYYIRAAFTGKFGKVLAATFSVLIILALGFMGNMVQSNSIGAAFSEVFASRNINIPPITVGLLIAVVAGFVFIGGTQRLASVVEKIVPIMAFVYIIGSLALIGMNISEVPEAFKMIIVGAFNPKAVLGGAVGISIKEAIRYGVARGLFSNEAGMGSAPNAAATATVSHPVKQGLIQTLGVFTDTLIICTCTAFIVLLSSDTLVQYSAKNNIPLADIAGIEVTQIAISSQVGSWGQYFIAFCIFFFAFSSIIGNYYYGETNIQFISTKKIYLYLYRILVIGMVLFGSVASMQLVWSIADVFMGLMAILNLIAIVLLSKIAIKALQDYIAQRKSGKNPVFSASSIPELGDEVEEWRDDEKEATA